MSSPGTAAPTQAGTCPGADEIERFVASGAGGPEGSGALRRHLESCSACRERERHVRENLEFMRDFMGVLGPNPPAPEPPPAPPPEGVLPGYRLVREIARGGQGVVYEGLQVETKRRVAVKIIEPGSGARAGRTRRRVEREAEIAAGLRHPNIVTVYDSTPLPDGRYALAMEFVEGLALDDWARQIDANAPRDRAGLREAVRVKLRAMAAVCGAVQFAHHNGVIHRDLKPANVLMDERAGGSDGAAVPRVVDFGVARRIEAKEDITRAGEFAGTLAYASPEQVSGDPDQVDTRSDIYSLGVILYEVLAGRRPYQTERSLTGAILNITRADPDPLGPIQPGDQGADDELETIVRRALAKERSERYQTAGALQDDIDNYLAGRAIEAKRESTFYVLRKAAARHRGAFAACAAFLVLLAAFAVAMAWAAGRLAHQRGLLASSLTASTIERGRLLGLNGANARAEELIWPELIRTGADVEEPGVGFRSTPEATQAAWALFEVYSRHPSLMHAPTLAGAATAVFEDTPGGGLGVRTLRPDGASELRRIPDGAVLERNAARFDPGAARVAFSVDRRRAIVHGAPGRAEVRLIEVESGKETVIEHPLFADLWWAEVSVRGDRFLTVGSDGVLRLWRVDPLTELRALATGAPRLVRARFSEDGQVLAGGEGQYVRAWNAEDGAVVASWRVPDDIWASAIRPGVNVVQMSPDRRHIAAAFWTWLLVFRVDRPESEPIRIDAHRGFVNFVGFSADSSVLLSSGHERDYRAWDPETGELLASFEQSVSWRGLASISHDGSLVAVCDAEDGLRVWETRSRAWLSVLRGPSNSVHGVRISPDGGLCAGGSADGSLWAWRAAGEGRGTRVWTAHPGGPGNGGAVMAVCFSPDGSTVYAAREDGAIIACSGSDGSNPRLMCRLTSIPTWIGLSPDGLLGAAAAGDRVHLFDTASGAPAGSLAGHKGRVAECAFSPDGKTLASAGGDGVCIIWDVGTRTEHARLDGHAQPVRAVAFSHDGSTIATGSDEWIIRLWDAASGRCTNVLRGARQHVFGLAFHPDGNVLFSCCRDPVVQAWDVRTGRELAVLEGHARPVLSLAISSDGRTLVTGAEDRAVGLWDLEYYQTYLRANAPAWRFPGAR